MITADTNIFVYASDVSSQSKQDTAGWVLNELAIRRAPVGLQVIGELQNVLRRRLRWEAWRAAETAGELLTAFNCFPMSQRAVGLALAQMAVGQISYWDALLLASARDAGCQTFISEDLQDGARLFGLEIVNPFGETGPSSRVRELLDAS